MTDLDLIVAGTDVTAPTLIDVAAFKAAHNDPAWLAFCERADEYLEATLVGSQSKPEPSG